MARRTPGEFHCLIMYPMISIRIVIMHIALVAARDEPAYPHMGTGKCDCGGRFELGVLHPCTRSVATLLRPPVCESAFARTSKLDATCLDADVTA